MKTFTPIRLRLQSLSAGLQRQFQRTCLVVGFSVLTFTRTVLKRAAHGRSSHDDVLGC